jgi:hypothetical protein
MLSMYFGKAGTTLKNWGPVSFLCSLVNAESDGFGACWTLIGCITGCSAARTEEGRREGIVCGRKEEEEWGKTEGLEKGRRGEEGKREGTEEGKREGTEEGKREGTEEGKRAGTEEGKTEGRAEGKTEGRAEGNKEGIDEGGWEGTEEGERPPGTERVGGSWELRWGRASSWADRNLIRSDPGSGGTSGVGSASFT